MAALILGVWLTGCMKEGAPNEAVEKAFVNRFGDVKSVKWTHNSDFSYAHFEQDNKTVVAVFGNDGIYMVTDLAKPLSTSASK